MPAKALEAGALARSIRLTMGSFRQVGTRQGKGTLRNIRIGKHCVLIMYTVTEEVVR